MSEQHVDFSWFTYQLFLILVLKQVKERQVNWFCLVKQLKYGVEQENRINIFKFYK